MSSGYGSSRSQQKVPARKFLTVRPLGARARHWPQFRSLRCSRTGGTTPVPAPRQFLPRPPLGKHLYQNVPVPIVPNTASQTSGDSVTQNSAQNLNSTAESLNPNQEADTSEPKVDENQTSNSKIKEVSEVMNLVWGILSLWWWILFTYHNVPRITNKKVNKNVHF